MRGSATTRFHRGFTILELMLAMAIFTMLGTLVVFMMRQGLGIFSAGTTDATLQDRTETVLPRIVQDLKLLALPSSFDPPPPMPSEEELLAGAVYVPPPPVDVRVRAGYIRLGDTAEGATKDYPCPYVAWVTDISGDRSDPLLRRAGEAWGPGQAPLTPNEVDRASPSTSYLASGGLREVCYIAVPDDPEIPALMTLYYGWRTPIGGEGTLLDPRNLDTLREIQSACRPIARGLLHFGTTWRRVFATDWNETTGRIGELDPYVGPTWDSTRALDKTFPLFRMPESLGDPSDDIFPAWARLELTLIAPTSLGLGRGETILRDDIGSDADAIFVEDATPLVGPGPDERWLKVDAEWMRYQPGRVDLSTGKIYVSRGGRSTVKAAHDAGAEVYAGLTSGEVVRLLFRDHFARREGRKP